jgi:hypothetical protein
MTQVTPRPGDFGLSRGGGLAMAVVRWGTGAPVFKYGRWFRRPAKYGHACVVVGGTRLNLPDGAVEVDVVEATPAGTRRVWVPVDRFDWSTGGPLEPQLTDGRRDIIVRTAIGCIGRGYDWLAIAEFIPRWAWSKYRGHDQDHPDAKVICSELVAWTYRVAGVVGLHDGRAPGSIAPSDLAEFLPG